MTIIDRYVAIAVCGAVLVVLLAFLGIDTVFALVEEMRDRDEGYGLVQVLEYVALTTPRRLYELLPYVVFIGALVGLGNLAAQSEIVVFRASGVSVYRLFGSITLPVLAILVFSGFLGEVAAPRGEQAAAEFKARATAAADAVALPGEHWYREGGLFMNIDALGDDGTLYGVRQYQLDAQKQMLWTRRAQTAIPTDASGGWLLKDVVITNFSDSETRVEWLPEMHWQANIDPAVLAARTLVEPRKLSMRALNAQAVYLAREGLPSTSYQLAFWSKALQPLAVLALMAIALSFVLGPLREVSMGTRLSVGILVGLAFKYLQDLLAPVSIVYAWPAWVAVLLPIALAWVVGLVGLRRVA